MDIFIHNKYEMLYQKEIDGKLVRKNRNEIVLSVTRTITDKKTGEEKEVKSNVYNPTHDMLLEHGWVEYVAHTASSIELTEQQLYRRVMARKLRDLENYDNSSDVNDCIILYQEQELHYWANKTERNDLKNAIRDCVAMGRTEYRLDFRDKGISITLPCELLLQMMAALEVYAIDCYNKTTDHNYAIKTLATLEEVEAYDFKVGYPEKLRFEV